MPWFYWLYLWGAGIFGFIIHSIVSSKLPNDIIHPEPDYGLESDEEEKEEPAYYVDKWGVQHEITEEFTGHVYQDEEGNYKRMYGTGQLIAFDEKNTAYYNDGNNNYRKL